MRIAIIAALSDNHVLGLNNALPWSLPDDWEHFRRVTGEHPFIMGRTSYEAEDRLLSPGRNVILTRQGGTLPEDNCETAPSLDAALKRVAEEPSAGPDGLVFITGGASVFREAMPLVNEAWLTMVHAQVEGDAWFPPIDWPNWKTVKSTWHATDEKHAHAFHIVHVQRKAPWSLSLPAGA